MKTKKSVSIKSPAPKAAAQSASQPQVELAVELDRRGKPLPPRQRVGGIITPQ
jgi:hypothetical protein